MKPLSYVMILGIAATASGVSHAGPAQGKVKTLPKAAVAKAPYLSITDADLSVRRVEGGAQVAAIIKGAGGNLFVQGQAGQPVSGIWTLFRSKGGGWEAVGAGSLTLKPGERRTVTKTVSALAGAWFKLEVRTAGSNTVLSAHRQAPPNVFAVKYRQLTFLNRQFKQVNPRNELIGAQARALAKRLSDLGFETNIKYIHRHTDWIVGGRDEYTQIVSFRCREWRERTFTTEAAARAFMSSLGPAGLGRGEELFSVETKLVVR